MKKRTRIIVVLAVLSVVLATIVYNYVFNASHRNIANEEASVVISATALHAKFQENESLATINYLDKVVQTIGEISSIEENDIVLDDKIQVGFISQMETELKEGQTITIKGRCVGYDELLEMVKIDQSVIITNQ